MLLETHSQQRQIFNQNHMFMLHDCLCELERPDLAVNMINDNNIRKIAKYVNITKKLAHQKNRGDILQELISSGLTY